MKSQYNFDNEKKKSLLTYFFFLIVALITLLYGQHLAQFQDNLRVWYISTLLIMLIGVPFILLQREAGLPEVWQSDISNKIRIWIPLAIGLFFGAFDVLVVKFILHPQPYDTLPPFLQPFPYSLFLYTSGAFEVEVFYRLIPLTLVLLIIGKWLLKGRHDVAVSWIIAILLSVREPIEQWQTGTLWFVVYAAISGFLFNLLQVIYFKKAGFLASMMVRLGHYLLWHILLGIYVEYIELPK